jgi:hypothetical protein
MERIYLYLTITVLSTAMAGFYIQKTQKDPFSIFSNSSNWINQNLDWSSQDSQEAPKLENQTPEEDQIEEEPQEQPQEPSQPEDVQPEIPQDTQPEINSPEIESPRFQERKFRPFQRLRNFLKCLKFWR